MRVLPTFVGTCLGLAARDQNCRWPGAKVCKILKLLLNFQKLVVDVDFDVEPKVIGNLYRAMNEFEAKTQLKFKMRDLNGGVVEDYIKVKHTTVWLSKFFRIFFRVFLAKERYRM